MEPYLTGDDLVDRMDPEWQWTCTCGTTGIASGRKTVRAEAAGKQHLLEAH